MEWLLFLVLITPIPLHNFIKGYYVKQNYENQQVHIVTRLDRDTSGFDALCQNGYAHARLDKQLQKKSIENVTLLWLQAMDTWSQRGNYCSLLRVMKTPLSPDEWLKVESMPIRLTRL